MSLDADKLKPYEFLTQSSFPGTNGGSTVERLP
jgi:hypothetical protein